MDTSSTVVNVHAARTHFSHLLARAHAGEEIIIAKAGKPYARLVPLEPAGTRPLSFVDAPLDDAFFEPSPEDELAEWG
jgi:prevent-host-death family protein